MKLICLLAVASGFLQSPPLPKVEPPKGVDVNVTDITWHPQGMGLLYTKPELNGKGIGIYALGQPEGEVVVHIGKNDSYEAQWFDNQTMATIIVYRDFVNDGEPYREASVYLADAVKGQSQLLWSQAFTTKSGGVDLDVDVSPRLRHAIYRVKNGQNRYHLVLPIGGTRLIPSLDLDKARRDGLSGPSWSLDGTAVFNPMSGVGNALQIGEDKFVTSGGEDVVFKVVSGSALEISGLEFKLSESNISLRLAKLPPPPVGATVLELMPANASLRQVRFKGPWIEPKLAQSDIRTLSRPTNVPFGNAAATASSLWLVSGKQPTTGLFLAAHAEKSWMSPGNTAVAYLTDGALFVRELGRGGR